MQTLVGVHFSPKRVLPQAEGRASTDSGGEKNAFITPQPVNQQHLSLEAKKRAVMDFEQLERMKQQPTLLTPAAAPQPRAKPTPTDLTGKLVTTGDPI